MDFESSLVFEVIPDSLEYVLLKILNWKITFGEKFHLKDCKDIQEIILSRCAIYDPAQHLTIPLFNTLITTCDVDFYLTEKISLKILFEEQEQNKFRIWK